MNNKIYMPILKGKKGEFDALKTLGENVQAVILPLIEVPAIAWDFINEKEASSIEKQISSTIKSIKASWDTKNEILIDTYYLEEDFGDGDKTLNVIMKKLIDEGYKPVPVLNVYASDELLNSLVYKDNICIRISFTEQELFDVNDELERIIKILKTDFSKVILLLDMNYISQENSLMGQISSKTLINSINDIVEFKDFYFSATSFPINLSTCKTNSVTEIERIEVVIHDYLKNEHSKVNRIPKFSDYGIANPDIQEMDPRLMTIGASVRYTGEKYWYIFKAASIKKHGSEQYYNLCSDIVKSKIYSGENYSWGDSQIYSKSKREGGPGNPTVWRQIGTNHHITLVVNQLSI